MTGISFAEIVKAFDEHLTKSVKQNYSDFYVGITNDVERRLFQEHKVNRETMWWIFRTATSKAVAEQVENYYLDKGMQGDTGGGTEESKIVYCYEIGPLTIDGAS